jgi:hypothetical protein
MFVATCMCVWEECRAFEEGHSLSIYASNLQSHYLFRLGLFCFGFRTSIHPSPPTVQNCLIDQALEKFTWVHRKKLFWH